MSEMIKDLLVNIQRKFPVCNVLDYTNMDHDMNVTRIVDIKKNKKTYNISVNIGNYNVYVLNIQEVTNE